MFVFATLVTREDGAVLDGVDEKSMFPPRRSLRGRSTATQIVDLFNYVVYKSGAAPPP
jgi:hypothetical protein